MLPNIDLLDIRHLRAVSAIFKTKNLTRAAKNLNVSQPAVSQQLKEIEQILGISLFLRSKKQMIITRAGEEVLESAQNILDELDKVSVRIARLIHGEVGELKIGMHCVLSYQWIHKILKGMQKAYPKVNLKIGNCHRPKKELLEKAWDVVIAAIPFEHPLLEQHSLFSDELVLLVHPKEKVAHQKLVTPKDLNKLRFISLTTRENDIPYNVFIAPDVNQSGVFMTVEQPEAILALVRDGFGIAVFPRWAAKKEIKNKDIIALPVHTDRVEAVWKAVTLKSSDTRPYHETFINYCKDL